MRPFAERDALIAARIMAGETYAHVGAHYGISRERVRQIAARAGLPPRMAMIRAKKALADRAREERRAAAFQSKLDRFKKEIEAVKSGASIFSQVANNNDRHRLSVVLARLGVKSIAKSRWTIDIPRRRKTIIDCRTDGLSWRDVALVVNAEEGGRPICVSSIYDWARRHCPDLFHANSSDEAAA